MWACVSSSVNFRTFLSILSCPPSFFPLEKFRNVCKYDQIYFLFLVNFEEILLIFFLKKIIMITIIRQWKRISDRLSLPCMRGIFFNFKIRHFYSFQKNFPLLRKQTKFWRVCPFCLFFFSQKIRCVGVDVSDSKNEAAKQR